MFQDPSHYHDIQKKNTKPCLWSVFQDKPQWMGATRRRK